MERDPTRNIGVIGLSARFPGPKDLGEWWSAILKGQVLTTRFTREMLIDLGLPYSLIDDPEYVPIRGYLEDADRFDNQFFKMSPRDAEMLDPQHRLMLEAAWSALEDSGYGTPNNRPITGVFASGSGSGYMRSMLSQGPLEPDLLEQVIHGTEPDFLASLISYKLGLTGPAVAIQTACSSSLVSLHLAIQSLHSGDCDQALVVAAGIPFPQAGYLHIPGGINSKTGICRPFDQNADGVVEGSGVACIVLRRLSDIPVDSPELYGVILGTAINNDGSSKAGYFAPSIKGQIEVIKKAVHTANVDPSTIGYLETHGTGTHIGDPIEWTSTSEAYRELGAKYGQIAVGALKANVGHLDSTSGLAALIKAMFVVKEGFIPPLANFEAINQYMDIENSPLYIPQEKSPWESQEPRRAAVSAFGIGGTNAHVIIEQPPLLKHSLETSPPENPQAIILSAMDSETLNRSAEGLKNYLLKEDHKLSDVSYTFAKGRTALPKRLIVCGYSSKEVAEKLANNDDVIYENVPLNGSPHAIFLFPGQGSQHPGMAKPFTSVVPGFLDNLEICLSKFEMNLSTIVSKALLDDTFPKEELNHTEIAQPALFALEYALAKSLVSLGITPSAVIGHSVGEITAACISSIFNLDDVTRFITERGRAMQSCPKGGMLAVNCHESEINEILMKLNLTLNIAAINTPESCVLAGDVKELETIEYFLNTNTSIINRRLKADRAFHSYLIEPALDKMASTLTHLSLSQARTPIALNYTGEILEKGNSLNANSFLLQARNTVQFSKSLMVVNGRFPNSIFIEVGTGDTLSRMTSSMGLNYTTLLPKQTTDPKKDILKGIGKLWAQGFPVDTSVYFNTKDPKRLHVPTYPFYGPKWLAKEAAAGLEVKRNLPEENSTSLSKEEQAISSLNSKKTEAVSTILSDIWVELLKHKEINENSDFFELGGDSLLITSLIRKVNNTFNIKAPPREMLLARTLGNQEVLIRKLLGAW